MTIERITDYATRGPAQLTERYRKPAVVSMLSSWLSELQEVEDALWDLLTQRAVDNAVGAQLDVLGRIVGQPREGKSDEIYRVWVAARILVLRSSGQTEQLIAIAKKLVGPNVPIKVEEYYPLAIVLHAEAGLDPMVGAAIAKLLSAAKGGGVSLQFSWFSKLVEPPFTLAPGLTSELNSPLGLDNGTLAAISNGIEVTFYDHTLIIPTDALVFDEDDSPLTFDGDGSYLTLG